MQQQTFQREMARLAAAMDITLSKPKAAVYWDALQDLDDDLFTQAVREIILEDDWFPRVARIRRQYLEVRARQASRTANRPRKLTHEQREKSKEKLVQIRDFLHKAQQ